MYLLFAYAYQVRISVFSKGGWALLQQFKKILRQKKERKELTKNSVPLYPVTPSSQCNNH